MIESMTFKNSESYYGKTASELLTEWSRNKTRNQIISVQYLDEGSIIVFYWND